MTQRPINNYIGAEKQLPGPVSAPDIFTRMQPSEQMRADLAEIASIKMAVLQSRLGAPIATETLQTLTTKISEAFTGNKNHALMVSDNESTLISIVCDKESDGKVILQYKEHAVQESEVSSYGLTHVSPVTAEITQGTREVIRRGMRVSDIPLENIYLSGLNSLDFYVNNESWPNPNVLTARKQVEEYLGIPANNNELALYDVAAAESEYTMLLIQKGFDSEKIAAINRTRFSDDSEQGFHKGSKYTSFAGRPLFVSTEGYLIACTLNESTASSSASEFRAKLAKKISDLRQLNIDTDQPLDIAVIDKETSIVTTVDALLDLSMYLKQQGVIVPLGKFNSLQYSTRADVITAVTSDAVFASQIDSALAVLKSHIYKAKGEVHPELSAYKINLSSVDADTYTQISDIFQ